MRSLALLAALAFPAFAAAQTPAAAPAPLAAGATVQTPTPPPGTLESSKIRLDAHDAVGALADAETALAHGGGADAYAARADAKRALGRPVAEAIADYAEAAKLDPRYIEKYQGLIAQQQSELHPQKSAGGTGLNGVPIGEIFMAGMIGLALIFVAVMLIRSRSGVEAAPDDEQVAGDGKDHPPADQQPPAGNPPPDKP